MASEMAAKGHVIILLLFVQMNVLYIIVRTEIQ